MKEDEYYPFKKGDEIQITKEEKACCVEFKNFKSNDESPVLARKRTISILETS